MHRCPVLFICWLRMWACWSARCGFIAVCSQRAVAFSVCLQGPGVVHSPVLGGMFSTCQHWCHTAWSECECVHSKHSVAQVQAADYQGRFASSVCHSSAEHGIPFFAGFGQRSCTSSILSGLVNSSADFEAGQWFLWLNQSITSGAAHARCVLMTLAGHSL